jgi:hypothetical protein
LHKLSGADQAKHDANTNKCHKQVPDSKKDCFNDNGVDVIIAPVSVQIMAVKKNEQDETVVTFEDIVGDVDGLEFRGEL